MPPRRKTLEEFFWSRVEKTETCWFWVGRKMTFGYGDIQLYAGGPRTSSHRASWEINVGPIPNGMFVLHKCDNPPCVNPDHLFLGTQKDNLLDARKKGRAYTLDSRWMLQKTHCPQGHEYSPENLRKNDRGWRLCKICHAALERGKRKRKKGK